MRKVFLVSVVLLLAALALLPQGQHTTKATFPDGFAVELEIADTTEERARGLMHRTLAENEGMLFVFDEPGRYAFWMKGVPEGLDILFLDESFVVVDLFEDVPACNEICPSYAPSADALYAIELRGGFSQRHSTTVGSHISIR